jgi:peptidyl-prolyl cis-trans isomerase SurA
VTISPFSGRLRIGAQALLLWATLVIFLLPASAGQGIIVVANDQPITELDITQRIALAKLLGQDANGSLTRKKALQQLIDDVVKQSEAKRLHVEPSDAEVGKQIEQIAKNMGTTTDGLNGRLAKQGISAASFRSYVTTQMGFNRIIASKYRGDVTVSDAEVDAKLATITRDINNRVATIMKDPRMKPVTVYKILEFNLPVEGDDSQLLQARAVEALQVSQQYKGCTQAKAATSGVFNVKINKPIDVDAERIPQELKDAIAKAGTTKLIGPLRTKEGIQMIAFCGSHTIVPPKPKAEMPTRDQVKNMLIDQKYSGFEEEYLKLARKQVYVEYRDPSYSQ